MKRLLWGVLALIGAGLLLVSAWIISNWIDAKPQPWPEALTPRAGAVTDKNDFWSALMAAPANGGGASRLSLGDCKSSDCSDSWLADAPRWAAMRQANAALGAACESGTARHNPQLVEPLPVTFKPDAAMPRFQPLIGCSAWLLSLALEASAAGNVDLAAAKLAQSARLNVAALQGSQSLIGHMITLAMVDRHLQALRQIAVQHPPAVAVLQTLPLPTAAQVAAAQRRWVPYEASYARSVIVLMHDKEICLDESELGNLWCRIGVDRKLPNYTEQLFGNQWLQVLANIHDDAPLNAFNTYQAWLKAPPTGLFGSRWHWRGTVPHILFSVAQPVYAGYLARSANTLLSAQATRLWLQALSQAPQERAQWLALQVKDTPLADRLTAPREGDWALQIVGAPDAFRAPIHWPAWRP